MPSAVDTSELPSSDSPTLALLHPTPEEKLATWKLNGSSWRRRLSLEAYLRREQYLCDQASTRDGGITFWVLVDTSATSAPRTILSSCETLRKRALVRKQAGRVEEVLSHGIGNVFCNPKFRGKGYAGRMIEELGKSLDTWQQENGKRAEFTVLYSDIGKSFYSKHGWKPFLSSHIALGPVEQLEADSHSPSDLPAATALYADDLSELCRDDEAALRARIAESARRDSNIQVALIPDVETMQWHSAREDFAAKELFNKRPKVKGAIVQVEEGIRVWCIWTRTFGNERHGNTLHILRLVIEGEEDFERHWLGEESSTPSLGSSNKQRVFAAASVLQAARQEAATWTMTDVQIWNPTPLAVLAAKHLDSSVSVLHRDDESIASLRWHGSKLDPGVEINWIGNEKYGWC